MKKILIIADGNVALHFVKRVMSYSSMNKNSYSIIYYNDDSIPPKLPDNMLALKFDPTSFAKLSRININEYYQVMIIMNRKDDSLESLKNLRLLSPSIQVVMLDKWSCDIDDPHLLSLNTKDILSSRFSDYLPDVPVIAQNVGFGAGEIMEIRVPIGSSYVYRHLDMIEQKNWHIAAIYRGNKLLLPKKNLMIIPNDIILAIGAPNVLQNVYNSIGKKLGQFPLPFGANMYCYIDMKMMDEQIIERLVNDAMLVHSNINTKKMILKIVNPNGTPLFEKLKSYDAPHLSVEVDYYEDNFIKILKNDVINKNVGLFICQKELFEEKENRIVMYNLKIPVLKTGLSHFSKIRQSAVILAENEQIEQSSSIIFDLSSQLDFPIKVYDFDPDKSGKHDPLVEHFESISKIYNSKVEIEDLQINPLRKLSTRDDILHFMPFNEKTLNSNFFSIFSTDIESLHFKLANSYQLFFQL
jgi:hypothetical protein